jgi:hypothetical protein
LPDRVSVGVLTRVFPPEVVDAVLLETGRVQQRKRALPARLMVYYVLGLALFSDASYEEVMRQLTEGLAWLSSWGDSWVVPDKAAIARARQRLGVEPLEMLYRLVAVPLSVRGTVGGFYRGWRVVSLDGSCLDVADTPANEGAFGRPGSSRRVGGGAFPMVRLVGVCESGSHAILDAELAPYRVSERVLADALVRRLTPGVVCLADRGIFGFERFNAARATGAELLWRVMGKQSLPLVKRLRDGSYLSRLEVPRKVEASAAERLVRVVEYTLADGSASESDAAGEPVTTYRLVTSILEPKRAPAAELAALYRERWEIENTLDELKTHQRGPRAVLRSKSPEGVLQEAYGLLLTHYAIRCVMHDAALSAGIDPDRLSFVRRLRAARRSARASTGFSPHEAS